MGSKHSENRLRAWREAAESCGLKFISNQIPLTGWAGQLMVRVEACEDDNGQSTRVVAVAPGPPDFIVVRIRSELPAPGEEIEVGDASFDSTFFVKGPPLQVFALLDAETRRRLLHLNAASRLEISLGMLRADMPDEKLPDLLPLLIDSGQRLVQSMNNVPRHLAENAVRDPEAGVRLHNLLLLIHELPGNPETGAALRAACSDPSPEIRLRAAKELGTEGFGVLFELAESLVDDVVSAEAISALDRELPFERARAILDHALRGRRIRTARACLEALGKSGAAATADVLVEVMEREEGGELAAVAAQSLGAVGSPAAEAALILALGRKSLDLRVAAANALGRAGSAAAVLPLKEAAEGFWLAPELRRAARQAIADIQSRLPGASPGQLSLAETEAGQLSLAADPAGQLSISGAEEELTQEPRRSE